MTITFLLNGVERIMFEHIVRCPKVICRKLHNSAYCRSDAIKLSQNRTPLPLTHSALFLNKLGKVI